ncbi:hypothetical protein TNCV_3589221 [Trichonephila clavipes]|nr:hypothetical protein TNCV_3589221 [Trichonephila clavipes]
MRATVDGPRNFELGSSDKKYTFLASSSLNFHTTPTKGLSLGIFNMHHPFYTAGIKSKSRLDNVDHEFVTMTTRLLRPLYNPMDLYINHLLL